VKSSVLLLAALALPDACNRKPPPEPTTHQLTEKERAPAKKKLDEARAKAPAMDLAHRDLGSSPRDSLVVPRPDLGQCPIAATAIIPEYPKDGATKSAKLSLAAKQKTRILEMTEIYKPNERTPEGADKTPANAGLEAILGILGPRVTGGSWASPEAMMTKVDEDLGKWEAGHDLTLITKVYDEPEVVTPEVLAAGKLVGTLYLFSRKEKKFICAAELDAKSAKAITVANDPDLPLYVDFLVVPIAKALPRLVVAGPVFVEPQDAGPPDAGKKKRK